MKYVTHVIVIASAELRKQNKLATESVATSHTYLIGCPIIWLIVIYIGETNDIINMFFIFASSSPARPFVAVCLAWRSHVAAVYIRGDEVHPRERRAVLNANEKKKNNTKHVFRRRCDMVPLKRNI